jgi:hypothetical protein
MGRMSGGMNEREEKTGGDGEEEKGEMGGVGRDGGMGVGGTGVGGKETWQLFESIMAAFALRKSKPKMGFVTFACRKEWEKQNVVKMNIF